MSTALNQVGRQHRYVLDTLAHIYVVDDMAKNMTGLAGFSDHYLKHVLTPHQQRLWQAFVDRIPEIRKDMLRLLEEERDGAGD
ncbi:MAG: hypothetical protein WED00_05740 [Aquisalimonadaceae bacterium]